MFNIFLHALFIIIVLYYIYINDTDYDRPIYQSVNEINYFFYKKTKNTKQHDKDKSKHTRAMKERCARCEEIPNNILKKNCRDKHNCDYYETIENFSNNDSGIAYSDKKTFNDKNVFIEFKILFLMFICIIFASHQHYGLGGDELSISNIFSGFTGGIENIIFLGYIIVLLYFLYGEMNTLYSKK